MRRYVVVNETWNLSLFRLSNQTGWRCGRCAEREEHVQRDRELPNVLQGGSRCCLSFRFAHISSKSRMKDLEKISLYEVGQLLFLLTVLMYTVKAKDVWKRIYTHLSSASIQRWRQAGVMSRRTDHQPENKGTNPRVWSILERIQETNCISQERITFIVNLTYTHTYPVFCMSICAFHFVENNCPSADSSSQRRLRSSW